MRVDFAPMLCRDRAQREGGSRARVSGRERATEINARTEVLAQALQTYRETDEYPTYTHAHAHAHTHTQNTCTSLVSDDQRVKAQCNQVRSLALLLQPAAR